MGSTSCASRDGGRQYAKDKLSNIYFLSLPLHSKPRQLHSTTSLLTKTLIFPHWNHRCASLVPWLTGIWELVIFLVKLFDRRPEKHYKWEPLKEDIELGNFTYPMVLVQVPIYNAREFNAIEVSIRDVKTSDGACYLALKISKSKMHCWIPVHKDAFDTEQFLHVMDKLKQ
ncbi:hypothetical protein V8G54_026199 [Vigna mungo]|uniref:Uncharacterized protein n=1 Tax=Vigna mungo TaxID=3915 RepID=A0AAQ3N050_VIGMU